VVLERSPTVNPDDSPISTPPVLAFSPRLQAHLGRREAKKNAWFIENSTRRPPRTLSIKGLGKIIFNASDNSRVTDYREQATVFGKYVPRVSYTTFGSGGPGY
jgi:hypothetical protein